MNFKKEEKSEKSRLQGFLMDNDRRYCPVLSPPGWETIKKVEIFSNFTQFFTKVPENEAISRSGFPEFLAERLIIESRKNSSIYFNQFFSSNEATELTQILNAIHFLVKESEDLLNMFLTQDIINSIIRIAFNDKSQNYVIAFSLISTITEKSIEAGKLLLNCQLPSLLYQAIQEESDERRILIMLYALSSLCVVKSPEDYLIQSANILADHMEDSQMTYSIAIRAFARIASHSPTLLAEHKIQDMFLLNLRNQDLMIVQDSLIGLFFFINTGDQNLIQHLLNEAIIKTISDLLQSDTDKNTAIELCYDVLIAIVTQTRNADQMIIDCDIVSISISQIETMSNAVKFKIIAFFASMLENCADSFIEILGSFEIPSILCEMIDNVDTHIGISIIRGINRYVTNSTISGNKNELSDEFFSILQDIDINSGLFEEACLVLTQMNE